MDCSVNWINESYGTVSKHYAKGEFKEGAVLLEKMKKCADANGYDYFRLNTVIYSSVAFRANIEYDECLDCLSSESILDYKNKIERDSFLGLICDYHYMKGQCYYGKGWYEQASKYYEMTIDFMVEQLGHIPESDRDYINFGHNFSFGVKGLFNNAAITAYRLGDYEKSIEYYNVSLKIIELYQKNLIPKWNWASTIQNQSMCYIEINDYDLAMKKINEAFHLLGQDESAQNSGIYSLVYKNVADVYLDLNEQDSAMLYISKSLNQKTQQRYRIYILQKAVEIYSKFKMFDEANIYLNELKSITSEILTDSHVDAVVNLRLESIGCKERNDFECVDSLMNESLYLLNPEWNGEEIQVSDFVNKREAKEILYRKARNLSKMNMSEATILYYRVVDFLEVLMNKYLLSNGSKYHFVSKHKQLFDDAISNSVLDNDYKSAFYFNTNSRSMILLSQIHDKKAIVASGITDEEVLALNTLKVNISDLEKRKFEALLLGKSVGLYKDSLFLRNREYNAYIQTLEEKYPTYHALKYQIPETSLPDLQKKLGRKEATLVEYFLGDDHMFIFVIDKDGIRHVETVPVTEELLDDVMNMNHCVSHMDFSYAAFDDFNGSSHRLYRQLIGNVREHIHNPNLIIIPDEQLNLIPFEALVSTEKTFRDTGYTHYHQLDYLIDEFDVSYHYSSNLIGMRARNAGAKRKDFLGIAPSFGNRNGVQELRNNLSEVASGLGQYPEGDTIMGLDATYEEVMSSIGDYRMVHFATHAIFNDNVPLDSRIELADTSIYIYEIFGLDHNLDLAIMSACETASGERRKGEGVISLSRAFIQSGCPSVIASLWSISDQKTSMLMQMFHKYMGTGESPKHSLSEAKRRYIDEAITKNVHPFYWSGFIQIGEVEEGRQKKSPYVWIGGGLLVLGGMYMGTRKWKQTKKAA